MQEEASPQQSNIPSPSSLPRDNTSMDGMESCNEQGGMKRNRTRCVRLGGKHDTFLLILVVRETGRRCVRACLRACKCESGVPACYVVVGD